jgi:hypothetical protein
MGCPAVTSVSRRRASRPFDNHSSISRHPTSCNTSPPEDGISSMTSPVAMGSAATPQSAFLGLAASASNREAVFLSPSVASMARFPLSACRSFPAPDFNLGMLAISLRPPLLSISHSTNIRPVILWRYGEDSASSAILGYSLPRSSSPRNPTCLIVSEPRPRYS